MANGKWAYPLDPDCPDVKRFRCRLHDDPMTSAMGAPVGDIEEAFERRHRVTCDRCKEYGVANVEVDI